MADSENGSNPVIRAKERLPEASVAAYCRRRAEGGVDLIVTEGTYIPHPGEFDLAAVGRSLIVNPDWPAMVQRGALGELQPFQRDVLQQLV